MPIHVEILLLRFLNNDNVQIWKMYLFFFMTKNNQLLITLLLSIRIAKNVIRQHIMLVIKSLIINIDKK